MLRRMQTPAPALHDASSSSWSRFGDLTAGGFYNPDNDVIQNVTESGLTSHNYTFLTVQTSEPRWSLMPASTNASTQYFFCEFHGPTGKYSMCWFWNYFFTSGLWEG